VRRSTGQFSIYLRPFNYLVDLITINAVSIVIVPVQINDYYYNLFISFLWLVLSWNIGFYEIYRYTKLAEIFEKIVKQFVLFVVINFAYIGFLMQKVDVNKIIQLASWSILTVAFIKLFTFYFLKRYRIVFGRNFRNVILVGKNENTHELRTFFEDNPDYGYKLVKTIDLKTDLLSIDDCFKFVLEYNIDEIYCAQADLSDTDIQTFIDFTDLNLKILKFLPKFNNQIERSLKADYYGYIPVVSLRNIPLEDGFNSICKRIFDIFFSSIVIICVLSWLIPILAILIKLESSGPVFFRQGRPGMNENEFFCYKFRSMQVNKITETEASRNDPRVTRIGRFLRKTSLDEMPQFFNVFLGDMSVVGPRPHLWSQNKSYGSKINKYMVRHFIKPGITGLAQVKGFRGEIETDDDMIKRINFDVFYIENWSISLDIKIILQTVVNIFKGEEKAY
jgi:putative colanic acid biosynthesis UDP-glucose lipid carrier transferase